jgi:AraC-like DNA-binding protein
MGCFFVMINSSLAYISLVHLSLNSATIGLSIFILFQSFTRVNQQHVKFLVLLYLFNLANQLDDWYELSELWQIIPGLTNAYIPFLFGIAPSFYLYVKQLVAPTNTDELSSHRNKITSWYWHYSGIIVAFIFCSPYYLLNTELKLERLLATTGTLEHLGIVTISPSFALFAVIPFSLCYLILIIQLLDNHLGNIKYYFSNIENKDLSWLRWTIILLCCVLAISTVQLFLPSSVSERWVPRTASLVFEFIWLTVFATLAIKQKVIYKQGKEFQNIKESKVQESTKYSRSKISEADMSRIEIKLIKAMEQNSLQSDPSLTLRKLSDTTGVSENRISQVLNVRVGMGFYDFVNYWRIKMACEKLKTTNESLLDITYAVGFNSRSTFNLAFKKHTGKTPSGYRKNNQI